MQWDIFCRVIDNFGDIGVCWRLANDLVERGQLVRIFVDDLTALRWMAPIASPQIEIVNWRDQETSSIEDLGVPGDVVIESFGCELPAAYLTQMQSCAAPTVAQRLWLNLEYLTAEDYAARCHKLPSPVMSGLCNGWTKYFFYPGFTAQTGGLLRELDLQDRQRRFDAALWLAQWGLQSTVAKPPPLRVSLFCYEPVALSALLEQLSQAQRPVELLVTAGRSATAVDACLRQLCPNGPVHTQNLIENWSFGNTENNSLLSILKLPYLSQIDFDHLLWSCDLNFVRGEDSLTRAIWANKPFVWQLYPQDDGAHYDKLDAFMAICQSTTDEARWFDVWNGRLKTVLPPLDSLLKSQISSHLAAHLLPQADLASQLISFAIEKTR